MNALKSFRMVRVWIRMLRILLNGSNLHSNSSKWLEWLDFPFESFESLSNGSNLHSNASKPFQMVRI